MNDDNNNTGDWNTGSHNTGSHNTGGHNIGDCNTGDWNTGDWNTGCCNTGHWNTGDWNTSDRHTGCFNTLPPEKAYYFNKLIDRELWSKAEKPDWICYIQATTWVPSDEMTEAEKQEHPNHDTVGGYLRKNDLKKEWRKAYNSATPEDIELTKQLPAFDAEVFLEVTGIDLREPKKVSCEGREIGIGFYND